MLTIVTGSPFAGKRLWVDREIEQAEEEGAVGWLALDFTSIFSAAVPGLGSVYRQLHPQPSAEHVASTSVRSTAGAPQSGQQAKSITRRP